MPIAEWMGVEGAHQRDVFPDIQSLRQPRLLFCLRSCQAVAEGQNGVYHPAAPKVKTVLFLCFCFGFSQNLKLFLFFCFGFSGNLRPKHVLRKPRNFNASHILATNVLFAA